MDPIPVDNELKIRNEIETMVPGNSQSFDRTNLISESILPNNEINLEDHPSILENHEVEEIKTPFKNLVEQVEEIKTPFKNLVEQIDQKKMEKEGWVKENKKNLRELKIKKIAIGILLGVAAALVVAGIGAVCVFCPPIAAIVLAISITAVSCGVIGYAVSLVPTDVDANQRPEEMRIIEHNISKLKKALDYAHNSKGEFEKFLERCPGIETEGGQKIYKVDDLDQYVALYEKDLELNENKENINKLNHEINTEYEKLLVNNVFENISKRSFEEMSEKIKEIEQQNEKIIEKTPQEQITREDENTIKMNEESITALKIIQNKMEKLSELEKKTITIENDYQEKTETLQQKIKESKITEGKDIRTDSQELQGWIENFTKIDHTDKNEINNKINSNNLYVFGHKIPTKIAVPKKNGMGTEEHTVDEKKRKAHKFIKNSFLSNSHAEDNLMIGGKKYNSVTHYMIIKRIEKSIEEAKKQDPQTKNKSLIFKGEKLIEEIGKMKTAKEAYDLALFSLREQPGLIPLSKGVEWNGLNFSEMDDELKTALYHKFILPNGEPTTKGLQLLKTGDKKIFICYELGDPDYEMRFQPYKDDEGKNELAPEDNLAGKNKLGIYLMELRNILRVKQENAKEEHVEIEEEQNQNENNYDSEKEDIPLKEDHK